MTLRLTKILGAIAATSALTILVASGGAAASSPALSCRSFSYNDGAFSDEDAEIRRFNFCPECEWRMNCLERPLMVTLCDGKRAW